MYNQLLQSFFEINMSFNTLLTDSVVFVLVNNIGNYTLSVSSKIYPKFHYLIFLKMCFMYFFSFLLIFFDLRKL